VAERIRNEDTVAVNLPILGKTRLPRADTLAYYGGVAALAAFEIIEWPVALVLGVGHVLAENHHSRVAQALGDALEDA
jgi:hypothetical protein